MSAGNQMSQSDSSKLGVRHFVGTQMQFALVQAKTNKIWTEILEFKIRLSVDCPLNQDVDQTR